MKVGDLVICRGNAVGIIIKLVNDKSWTQILWHDNRFTWEEVEPSFVPGVIEVISEV